MIQSLDKLKVLEDSLFTPYHEKLLPLVMLEIERKKLVEKRKAEKNSAMLLSMGIQKAVNHMSFETAFEHLKNSKAETVLEQIIKNYFIENMPQNMAQLSSSTTE